MGMGVLILGFADLDGLTSRIAEAKKMDLSPICVSVDGIYSEYSKSLNNARILGCHKYILELFECGEIDYILLQEKNLGQAVAIPKAISWFFSIVDFGIIIEDDCEIVSRENALDYMERFSRVISNDKFQVLCFSNIWPEYFLSKVTGDVKPKYFETNFFNSWGWATSAPLWNSFSTQKEYNFFKIVSILKATQLRIYTRFMLAFEWDRHFRISKRKRKQTWALKFTLFLIEKDIKINISGVNLIKHCARDDAAHITRNPSWLSNAYSNNSSNNRYSPVKEIFGLNRDLETYTAQIIHGAKVSRLIKGFAFRLLVGLKIK